MTEKHTFYRVSTYTGGYPVTGFQRTYSKPPCQAEELKEAVGGVGRGGGGGGRGGGIGP